MENPKLHQFIKNTIQPRKSTKARRTNNNFLAFLFSFTTNVDFGAKTFHMFVRRRFP